MARKPVDLAQDQSQEGTDANSEDEGAFERFESLARKLFAVPKSEVLELRRKQAAKRAK